MYSVLGPGSDLRSLNREAADLLWHTAKTRAKSPSVRITTHCGPSKVHRVSEDLHQLLLESRQHHCLPKRCTGASGPARARSLPEGLRRALVQPHDPSPNAAGLAKSSRVSGVRGRSTKPGSSEGPLGQQCSTAGEKQNSKPLCTGRTKLSQIERVLGIQRNRMLIITLYYVEY